VFNLNLGISIQFISSCMQCYSIFSFEWNLIFTKSIHIFHQLIVTSIQQHKLQAKITTFQKKIDGTCQSWKNLINHSNFIITQVVLASWIHKILIYQA
jgi:hypothetical protein